VIVSTVGGPKELVEPGVNGFVTKALDAQALADAVRTIVVAPELRAEMSRRARESVADRSWPAAFEKFWAATATYS
jgi:glycosyltransferase involved in cell wall biosynthesis